MSNFVNPKPLGYAFGEKLPNDHVDTIWANLSKAINGDDGSSHSPASTAIDISGERGFTLSGNHRTGVFFTPQFGVSNWITNADVQPSSGVANGGDFDTFSRRWVVAGGTDKVSYSADDGVTWTAATPGSSAVSLRDLAISGQIVIAAGDSATGYRAAAASSLGSWSNVTFAGSPNSIRRVRGAKTATRFLASGSKSGGAAGYLATSTDGTTWTERTVPAGMSAMVLGSSAMNPDGTTMLVASVSPGHTKVARSADSGATWAESSGTLVSDFYHLAYNIPLSIWVAVGTSGGRVYTSGDGNAWDLQSTWAMGGAGLASFGGTQARGLACYGSALVLIGNRSTTSEMFVSASFDRGVTWSIVGLGPGTVLPGLISDGFDNLILASAGTLLTRCLRRAPA